MRATQRGDALLLLGLPAKIAVLVQGLFPRAVIAASGLVTRLLPQSTSTVMQPGTAIEPPPGSPR